MKEDSKKNKNVIKLANPILFDGEKIKELTYNTEKITGKLFAEAETAKQGLTDGSARLTVGMAPQTDYTTQLYMGYAAIIAENPQYSFEDLEQIRGTDVIEIHAIGRNFTYGISGQEADSSQEETSEDAKETTEESTTQTEEG